MRAWGSRKAKDRCATRGFRAANLLVLGACLAMVAVLAGKALPILRQHTLGSLFLATAWRPWQGEFGLAPFILGSLAVTVIALLLAAPVSILGALYLSEFATRRARSVLRLPIDLLAGIPSVVFGLFGLVAVVPGVAALAKGFGIPATGYSILAGGLLLAIMVTPVILSIALEVFLSIPLEARIAALALGATRWETTRFVVLRKARAGVGAAIVLGFARAFGETIAVMMVVGNVARVPHSLFDPGYPLPALIANNYGELMSIPDFDAVIFLAALVLMALVGLFSLAAHLVLHRMTREEC